MTGVRKIQENPRKIPGNTLVDLRYGGTNQAFSKAGRVRGEDDTQRMRIVRHSSALCLDQCDMTYDAYIEQKYIVWHYRSNLTTATVSIPSSPPPHPRNKKERKKDEGLPGNIIEQPPSASTVTNSTAAATSSSLLGGTTSPRLRPHGLSGDAHHLSAGQNDGRQRSAVHAPGV